MANKVSDLTQDRVVLRSVFGKVGQKYYIQPMIDPRTGRYPDCVRKVNSQGDMILTDAERNSGDYFVPTNRVFEIEDGKEFDLTDKYDKADWEAIKNCPLIAPDRFAKDDKGNYLIDGTMGFKNPNPRYGRAELYVEHPGEETQRRVSKKEKYRQALNFICDDPKGATGRRMIARLAGKNMEGVLDTDVQDYLMEIAERDPDRIIELYVGDSTSLRLLFIEAKDKKVIYVKSKLYMYADNIVLGATEDAVISWMKDSKNKKTLDLIRKDTYPDLHPDEK